nr:transcriptional regulator [Brevundimonas variabilis]
MLGLFGGASTATSSGSSAPTAARKKVQPTAPWSAGAKVPDQSASLRAALAGRRVINEGTTQLDLPGASNDYKKLFALYQGLETLRGLTARAGVRGISGSEQALLAKRFEAGIAEVSAYLDANRLEGVRLTQGVSQSTSKTTAGVARDSTKVITAGIHEGGLTDAVAAFQGDVAFNISVTSLSGQTSTIALDLAELGAAPRTLEAVVNYANDKLAAAGVETRLGYTPIASPTKVVTYGSAKVTLPDGPARYSLTLNGSSTETVAFAAARTADAVYVVQSAGKDGVHELLKFQSDGGSADAPTGPRLGETNWVEGRVSQTGLDKGLETVRASATGADGSLWVVADVDAGTANQPIKGRQDVALQKYDSSGRLLFTRALGAADSASGYALAVDANGRVAVAGSVTGALVPGEAGADARLADSFVTVFDADGLEQWSQRRGATAADEATSVAFGNNGQVFVGGRSQSAIPGAGALGGWDGYVQTFTETAAVTANTPPTITATASQFGTGSDDGVQALTVDGSNLYTAGVEDGRAVLRRFSLDTNGVATLAQTRDLGFIAGEIAGIAVSGGRVIVTGQTGNEALDAGTVTRAHSGGTDVFIASLGSDLVASTADRLTFHGSAGEDSAADVKVHAGKVWITGVSDRDRAAKPEDPTQGYLARLDPTTGAIEYSRSWSGKDLQATPRTLAIAAGGASVLDRLGLPTGPIAQSDSKLLTAATSLRAGDRFTVTPADGRRGTVVTIDARDTLQTLQDKITRASGRTLKVTLLSEGAFAADSPAAVNSSGGGVQRLSITAVEGRGAILKAGEPGRDALAGLGLSPGFIGKTSGTDTLKTFGLNLARNLRFDSDPASIKAADEAVELAIKSVKDAYDALKPKSKTAAIAGPAPAYQASQIANYQAALARLTG